MTNLCNPQETQRIVRAYDLNVTKKFGQNFLIDSGVRDAIVEASGVTKETCVLEIGPGIGTLTQALSLAARRVIAVEIDRGLIPVLGETLSDCDNVTVLQQDILKTDLQALSDTYNDGKPFLVAANLPYYITTPILLKLLSEDPPPSAITVMVQKEMAERMCAREGGKEYGALSLAVQYYAHPVRVCDVPPGAFLPQPKVQSAVLRLEALPAPPVTVRDRSFLFEVIRAAFSQRRKTLVNSLSAQLSPGVSKVAVREALHALGKPEDIRGERLSLAEFAALADRLIH